MFDFNFSKTIDSLLEMWIVKIVLSALVTATSFLFGDLTESYIALCVLIFIDLFSKWLEIVKKYMIENQKSGWYLSFKECWATKKLSSYEMRTQFVPKIIAYMLVIISAHQVSLILPKREVLGVQLGLALKDVMITYLALTEFMSINENIIAMGGTFLAPFAFFVKDKRDKLLSVDDSNVKKFRADFNNIDKSPHGLGHVIKNESEEK